MGLIDRLERMRRVGKRQCSRLCRRIRAATKTRRNGGRKRVRFQYDPYSYAMNFDDGMEREMREKEGVSEQAQYEKCAERRRRILVYVVFLK